MPTVFSHGIVATALGAGLLPPLGRTRYLLIGAACAMAPDADVIAFTMGIPYGHLLGHRGLSHSLCVALMLGVLAGLLTVRARGGLRAHWRVVGFFVAAAASHGLLDAMTDGGRGIALLAPFDETRYFFPWRPIRVSPIGLSFFSNRGVEVLSSELRWLWLPSLLFLVAVAWIRKVRGVAPRG